MCHCILWNCLSFGTESKNLWYDGVTHYQWHSVVQMGSGKGDSYPLSCIMYIQNYRWPKPSPPSNRCRVLCRRCPWVNSMSYADDMVVHAPTVTALQTLLQVCHSYVLPHDIVNNTTKTVCMLVLPKQLQGQFSTRVRLGNEELSFVEEFRYQGHIMAAHCRDEQDIKKQYRRQNAVGNMLVKKFSFVPIEAKIQLFKSYCYPIYEFALWRQSL